MTRYGYARVSTLDQDLSAQIETLINKGVPSENIFAEKFTGHTNKRPQFEQLCVVLRPNDELIVTALDRLGRKTSEVTTFLDWCTENDIVVDVLNMGRLDNTPGGKLLRNVMSAFAQFERDMIVERTREGKERAKRLNPNFKDGRPRAPITPRKRHAYELLQTHSYTETEKLTGFSRSTLQRIKKRIEEEQ